jgi:hypothetical protein
MNSVYNTFLDSKSPVYCISQCKQKITLPVILHSTIPQSLEVNDEASFKCLDGKSVPILIRTFNPCQTQYQLAANWMTCHGNTHEQGWPKPYIYTVYIR